MTSSSATGRRRLLLGAAVALGLLPLVAFVAGWLLLRGSLPPVDGTLRLPGLVAPVTVERDGNGVPTIRAESREDAARALGFLHGQDRFFQADLYRRQPAGELAALVGKAAVGIDRNWRPFRLRRVAEEAYRSQSAEIRRVLQAYAQGMNAGLASLGVRPFEYLLLRERPAPWRPEDSILVLLTMYLTLENPFGGQDIARAELLRVLPPELLAFVEDEEAPWSAPVLGEPAAPRPVPGPDVLDLRAELRAIAEERRRKEAGEQEESAPGDSAALRRVPFPLLVGSNAWAVAGTRTRDGRAILANDMHLPIEIPNTWYRAVVEVRPAGAEGMRLTGLFLPGAPWLVAGTNGKVAWGFTALEDDWSDAVELVQPGAGGSEERDDGDDGGAGEREDEPAPPEGWIGPDGSLHRFRVVRETIEVAHGDPVEIEVRETPWGPALPTGGRWYARLWGAARPDGLDATIARFETASSVAELLGLGARAGLPHLNLLAADAEGHVGWVPTGRIPRRTGFDGSLPARSTDAGVGWEGWLPPDDRPRVLDPPGGLLWSANQRMTDAAHAGSLPNRSGAHPVRAWQIAKRLRELPAADERAMLAIQLDDRVFLYDGWREVLLAALDGEACRDDADRREFRRLVAEWKGHASVDSAGFRLLNAFYWETWRIVRGALHDLALARGARGGPWLAEPALRRIVLERPEHLLPPAYDTWDELLLDAVDRAIRRLREREPEAPLASFTWGRVNVFRMRHPFSGLVPGLSRLLDLPPTPLPGCRWVPRVQTRSGGASERLVVAPGHEDEGILHLPGGISGHPLSPWYAAGHGDWVRGRPSPLLPGPPEHRVTLTGNGPR